MKLSTYLTERQKEIILFVFRFRFLNRIQLQTLLYHKDYKRINIWLKQLTKKEYLGREYNQRIGENRKPAIYYLGKEGRTHIKNILTINNSYINKVRSDENISLRTMNHDMQAANFFIALRKYVKEHNEQLEYYTKAELTNEKTQKSVVPDAFFFYRTIDKVKLYSIEIEMETETRTTFKKKIAKYFFYFFSNTWKTPLVSHFPTVALVCLTQKRLGTMLQDIEKQLEKYNYPPVIFKLTTMEQIKTQGINNAIWYIPVQKEKIYKLL